MSIPAPSFFLRYAGYGLITAAAFSMAAGQEGFGYIALGGFILLIYSWIAGWLERRKR